MVHSHPHNEQRSWLSRARLVSSGPVASTAPKILRAGSWLLTPAATMLSRAQLARLEIWTEPHPASSQPSLAKAAWNLAFKRAPNTGSTELAYTSSPSTWRTNPHKETKCLC